MREVELGQAGKLVPAVTSGKIEEEGGWIVAAGKQIYRVKAGQTEAACYEYPFESEITALHQIDSDTCLIADSEGLISRLNIASQTLEKVHKGRKGVTAMQGWAGVVVVGTRNGGMVVGGEEEIALQGVGAGEVLQVTFSPSGRLFTLITSTATLSVYRLGSWELLHSSSIWTSPSLPAPQLTVGWNTSGEVLALPGDVRLNFLRPEEETAEATEFQAASPIVAVAYTRSDEHIYLMTLTHSLLLYSQLSRTVVAAYMLPSLPPTFSVVQDGVYCSWEYGRLCWVNRSDFKLATARRLLQGDDIDPFHTAIGVLPQDTLPSSTPTLLFQSILGSITRSEQHYVVSSQQMSAFFVDVTFSKRDFHQNLHFEDISSILMAHMSESGAVFGSKLIGELGEDDFVEEDKKNRKAMIQFKSFKGGEDWVVKLSGREDVEKLSVGASWCAVLTSKLFLRVFTCRGGAQLYTFSFSCPILALYTHNDTLAVLYQADLPTLGLQRLAFSTYDIRPAASSSVSSRLKGVLAPIPPQETITWAGFSSEGDLCCVDSKGDVRMYSAEYLAWERVGRLEEWKVVGISKSEVYGFDKQGKYLRRQRLQIETGKEAITGETLAKLLLIPGKGTLNDQFLQEFTSAIESNSESSIHSLLLSLSSHSDISKAFKGLRALSPALYTALAPLRQTLLSEQPAKLTKEA